MRVESGMLLPSRRRILRRAELAYNEGRLFWTMASVAYVEGYACIHFSWCDILNSACRSHLDFRRHDGLKWSSQRAQNVPSSAPSSISDSGRKHLDDLSRRANKMEQQKRFLRESIPSPSRFGSHCNSCPFLRGGNCSCNNGAYTFAGYDDIEAQLLKPGNINGVKTWNQKLHVAFKTSITLGMLLRFCTSVRGFWVQEAVKRR